MNNKISTYTTLCTLMLSNNFQFGYCEKIRFNDGINSKLEDLPKPGSNRVRPTILPPLSYKFNHLFKHDEQCFDFINSEFTYSMCPFKSMEQESLTSLSRDIHNLGIFAGFRIQNWTITGLEYLFGDIDGCESHRDTFVEIRCGKSDRLIKLDEINSCSYSGLLEWKNACDPDKLLLYPILSELGKKEFIKIKSAWKNNFLTQEGVDFYLSKLLVEEGLKIDKESVLNSPEYETWKSQNEARSECESDIDRLKSEIAELKSDLATCRSQAELDDL